MERTEAAQWLIHQMEQNVMGTCWVKHPSGEVYCVQYERVGRVPTTYEVYDSAQDVKLA